MSRRQSGSIVINTAIALSLIVIALVGTELGYLFFMKRELQKTADLAAIAGASAVLPADCTAARTAALTNAGQNLAGFTPVVACGRWDPAQGTERHFTAGQTAFNAMHVVIEGAPPPLLAFFPGERSLRAEAIAAATDPLASFSVGSTLLRTGDSVLGDLLKGIGLDLTGTSLVGYDGLAQVQITPAGLLQALGIPVATDIGVGELNTLLAAETVQLGPLLNAIVTAGGQDTLLASNAALLNAVATRLGVPNLEVQLGSLASGPSGLFAEIIAPGANAASALNVGVNALDLLYSAIGVATQKHAVAVNGLSLAGLVSAKTVLIEPPSVAIGGVGATAYTAQLRTWIEISTSNLPVINQFAQIKLPIMVDLVNGRGTLTEMCTPALRKPDGTERASIAVNASIVKVCVGRPGANPANENEIFSTSASCDQNLADEDLLRLGLGPVNLVSLRTHLKMDALPLQASVTLAAGETGTVGNDLLLGSTVKNITDALLATLLVETLDRGPALTLAQRQASAQNLWNAQGAACGSRACRVTRLTNVKAGIENTTNGLGGFLGGLSSDVLALLSHTLTLNLQGLLTGVGNLVGGLLTSVGDILGAVLGGVIGGCSALIGSNDAACVNEIANSLNGNSSGGGDSVPNAITALTGYLLQVLRPLLDGIGSSVLTPILHDVLGLHLGQIDVHLRTLNCQARAHLVY
ncbi:MAG: pilus assembly protein TadG-related protein [Hydrogenophaga sp.]|uniref:pilus assembly protein TadG-related protein n=1 Tax=Hydrogenophaga sp. TaxID=1904254 RepID=UPI004035C10D